MKNASHLLALTSAALWISPLSVSAQGAAVSVATAQQAAAPSKPVAASVLMARAADGSTVMHADILADAQRIPDASRAVVLSRADNVQRMAEGLLVRRSLAARAQALNLDQDQQLQAELQQARDKVLSDAYLRHVSKDQLPTKEAIENFARTRYQVEQARFAAPAQTRASHILLTKQGHDARAKAEAMLQVLRGGAAFEELARKESIDYASAARGGDLGLFSSGRMVKPFEDAVNLLKQPGELSGVVETQFGYHIIRLDERREARTLSFEEVKEQLMADILTTLQSEKREQAVNAVQGSIVVEQAAVEAVAREFAQSLVQAQKP